MTLTSLEQLDLANNLKTKLIRLYSFRIAQLSKKLGTKSFFTHFNNWQNNHPTSNSPAVKLFNRLFNYLENYYNNNSIESIPSFLDIFAQTGIEPDEKLSFPHFVYEKNIEKQSQQKLTKVVRCKSPCDMEVEPIGKDPLWLKILSLAKRVAKTNFHILIYGETGVGKDLIANAIVADSPQADAPKVVLNSAAISESLLETELFGYEEGSFTGALKKGKIGWIEKADGGTLILDEISDLSLKAQSILLRTLQSGEIQAVGAKKYFSKFRLIAISNKPLEPLVRKGLFREDLFYRIDVIPILVPTLSERSSDIERLASHFLSKYKRSNGSISAESFSRSAIAVLKQYEWPGNVRQLQNVIQRALILCEGKEIQAENIVFNSQDLQFEAPEKVELQKLLENLTELNIGRVELSRLCMFLIQNRKQITSGIYAAKLQCNQSTARRHLNSLCENGILMQNGDKKDRNYTFQENLENLIESES